MPEQDTEQALGPIDLLVVEMPPAGPGPEGFAALLNLAERDLVRILDFEVVSRSTDGTMSLVPADVAEMPELAPFVGSSSGLLDADDLHEAGAFISPGSRAS